MQYGYFDQEQDEYVITRPDTPTPWINYLGSGEYGGIISNTGGGYSFYKDPAHCRLTRYRYNNIPADRPGRYLYLRDPRTEKFWNPGFQPTAAPLDFYECRHGLGYTVLNCEKDRLYSSVRYFVPENACFEIWHLKVKNFLPARRKIQVFSFAEFSFHDAAMDQQNVDWVQQINQGRCRDNLITWYTHMDPQKVTFFTCSQKPHSFDTNLESFIGPYRDYSAPAAVTAGTCFNSISRRTNGTGAFCHELTLEGNSSSELIFILGFSSEPDKIAGMVKPYLQSEQSRDAYKRLRRYWQNYTSKLQVKTPDADMNLFVNTWNQYQCKTTYNWSRFVSLYQLGFARGMGVRDSSQDILGVMHTIPKKARQKISRLLQCQYPEGKSYHLYFPLSGKGGEGDAPVKKYDWYSDDHLWLVLATNSYLKESGDMDFLKEKIPFNDSSDDSVAVHLHKAVSFTAAHLGPHQLALAGRADWNDGLNLDTGRGIAESIFTSLLYMRALRELIELYTYLKDDTTAAQYTAMYDKMKKAVNNAGWDGKWFLRAYDDQGNKLGSAACKRGQIFVNPQSWAVFSGAADIKQGNMILDAVDKKLNTPYGIVILEPAYQKFDANIGGLTTYPPGAKENGGIFCHTNPWVMIAAAMLGRGEDAFRYYKQILPAARNDRADLLEVEPYVYPQNILGREHPQTGIGRNSWLSGTASWNMVAAARYILGVRPDYNCLQIDPCIPRTWPGFKIRRVFRGAVYNIEVKNDRHVSKGVKQIIVDGKKRAQVPVFAAGSEHNIIVEMGD